jgi:hypothetical protein
MTPQSIVFPKYGPGANLCIELTGPPAYDFVTALVLLELELNGSVVWRYRSGETSDITIVSSTQVVINIPPALDSLDSIGNTFAEAVALAIAATASDFEPAPYLNAKIDVITDNVDFRLQGKLKIGNEHGEI